MGEIGAQIIDLATTVDTIRGTNQAKADSKLDNLSDTAYDNLYQALSETNDNVTERDIQNHLFQQALQDYTNQSRPSDILIQDNGRWVVKGNDGRIHLIEPDGEVVTSFKNSDKNTAQRIRDGRWNRPSNEKLDEFKEKFSDYVRW